MALFEFEAEYVSRKIEITDLTSAIREDLVRADSTLNDSIKVLGFFLVAVDLGIASIQH